MSEPLHTEVRAALRDPKRVSVALSGSAAAPSLKVLIEGVPPPALKAEEPAKPVRAPLTRRELQILRLIAQGLHNRQIAARIRRSIKTVEKHRQNLHSKLSTHEVAGLTQHAMKLGLIEKAHRAAGGLANCAKRLTPRELEVLKLVAQGSGNKWIASELNRSIKTVDHHRENIMKKLDIHEVAGLTWYALSLGLL